MRDAVAQTVANGDMRDLAAQLRRTAERAHGFEPVPPDDQG